MRVKENLDNVDDGRKSVSNKAFQTFPPKNYILKQWDKDFLSNSTFIDFVLLKDRSTTLPPNFWQYSSGARSDRSLYVEISVPKQRSELVFNHLKSVLLK